MRRPLCHTDDQKSRSEEYLEKFKLYENEMEKEENVIFAGRLAKYKYYNMDLVVKDALEIFENEIK